MTAAEWEAAGLYDPAAPNAAERLELLEWLAGRGVTLDAIVRASRERSLTGLAGDLLLERGRRHYTLAEIVDETGLSPERVRELSVAAGLLPARENPDFTEESLQMLRLYVGGATLFGSGPLVRFLRIVGSSLARVAEAAVSLFYVNIEGPMRREGRTERALAEANLQAIEALDGLQIMLQGLFRSHMHAAINRFRLAQLGEAVDTAHMTVGFVDLVGFTALSTRMATRDLVGVIERFEEHAQDVVTSRGGRVVKLIGDEVMFVTLDAAAGCDTALALFEEFAHDAAVTPRGALATGDLIIRGGDYYGPIVNLASRLAELAVPKELLATPAVAAAARSATLQFEPAGKRMLKGLDEPVTLFSVARA